MESAKKCGKKVDIILENIECIKALFTHNIVNVIRGFLQRAFNYANSLIQNVYYNILYDPLLVYYYLVF